MNISGPGPSICRKIFAANLVKMLRWHIHWTVEDFLLLDLGIKENGSKLYQAIQAFSKENSAENFCLG